MREAWWDGIIGIRVLKEEVVALRTQLADYAKRYQWDAVLEIVANGPPSLLTCVRPGGTSWYTVLHQAAHGDAPVEVVERLLDMGALRGQRTKGTERAVDIARRRGNARLSGVLEPVNRFAVPDLPDMQVRLHSLIRKRARTLLQSDQLHLLLDARLFRFPDLEPTLDERVSGPTWFPVPGMYGGFAYRFDSLDDRPVLSVESWSRVVGGSGQAHIVTPHGFVLVEDGFV